MPEPLANRTLHTAFRASALALYGKQGIADIRERMTPECRAACVDPVTLHGPLLPERFLVEWFNTVYEGPCNRDMAKYLAYIDHTQEGAFGRVHKLLIKLATPAVLAKRAAALWRHDHDTGELRLGRLAEKEVAVHLVDHVYVDTPLARKTIAEILRYCVSLIGVSNVTAMHAPGAGRTLDIVIRWK